MSRLKQFRLPDLGEGLTEGEILQWLVRPGDAVRLNQPIVEVETAKAAVEVPSPYAGVVHEILHAVGETVDVGAPIITVDTDPGAGPLNPVTDTTATAERPELADLVPGPAASGALIGEVGPSGRTATLVGYGPKSGPIQRRARTDVAPPRAVPATAPAPATAARVSAAAVGQAAAAALAGSTVLAKPPVRKLAKDLGVDLATVVATGPHSSVTRADVQAAAGRQSADGAVVDVSGSGPDRERRIPIKGVRKLTAAAMVASAFTAPHVTEFLTVDMTESMNLRTRLKALPEFTEVAVSPLLLVAKALLLAVARHPEINATWDEQAQEIVVKSYVNLGIAAATPRGLVVPNIKDAGRLSLAELAVELQELTRRARDGRTSPEQLARGTITITNVGTFGVDTGTPILNPGESAILCFGAVRPTPWVVTGPDGGQTIAIRQVSQLALSFDHRNVDGQLGSHFLADIGRVLTDPATALAWS